MNFKKKDIEMIISTLTSYDKVTYHLQGKNMVVIEVTQGETGMCLNQLEKEMYLHYGDNLVLKSIEKSRKRDLQFLVYYDCTYVYMLE